VSVDWADLYRTTYEDLYRFLHSKVWDPERAHDLTQETFVRALQHEPDKPRAWLFSVAANLARDEARTAVRRKRHLELLRSDTEAESVAEPVAPQRLEQEERSMAVRGALHQLSERDRDVLLLWNAGRSYAEIAEQTGLSSGAIGTTLARARKRLVEAYEGLEKENVARNRR
jgi:RNA polymerase sigma factor (sigma-70 family)